MRVRIMGIYETKTFRSGNSEAVRIPKDIAFGEGVEVVIERVGDGVVIRRKRKQDLKAMVQRLRELGAPDVPMVREEIEVPDRFNDRD